MSKIKMSLSWSRSRARVLLIVRTFSKWAWTSSGFIHATCTGEFVTAGTDPFVHALGHTWTLWTAIAKTTTGHSSELRAFYNCFCGLWRKRNAKHKL